ncbi:unnamed protein product [Nyctereutes procyonoides]|uniref:(raccoon dog) hypothetical protein n=1 Tax=Nyctereutes procyonoides TaxID=34880 RepID=A0A811YT63_NYCPR|nr:unnamed protein product [Nyctereutes procyonoides]
MKSCICPDISQFQPTPHPPPFLPNLPLVKRAVVGAYLFRPVAHHFPSSSTSLLHVLQCLHLFAPSLGFEIQQHLTASHLSGVCTCLHPVSASKSSNTSLLRTSPVYAPVCTRVSASKSSSTSLLRTSPVYAPVCTSLGFEIQQHLATPRLSGVCTCLHPESWLRNPTTPVSNTALPLKHYVIWPYPCLCIGMLTYASMAGCEDKIPCIKYPFSGSCLLLITFKYPVVTPMKTLLITLKMLFALFLH